MPATAALLLSQLLVGPVLPLPIPGPVQFPLCAAIHLISDAVLTSVLRHRELTLEEAYSLIAGCAFHGGDKLVHILFKLHPEWGRLQCRGMTRDERDLWVTASLEPQLCK